MLFNLFSLLQKKSEADLDYMKDYLKKSIFSV